MFLFGAEQSAPNDNYKNKNLGSMFWLSVCIAGTINGYLEIRNLFRQ